MMKPTTLIIAALATVGALAQDPTRTEGAGLVSEPVFTTVASVSPSFYTIPRGSVLSAGTWDLFYSDNVPLVLQSDRGGGMSAQVMVEGRLPIDPTALSLTVETHATMPGVQQVVALWDWNARNWVVLGIDRVGSWDTALEYVVPGDVLRFSEAGTGRMHAAIGFRSSNSFGGWQARVDQVYWTYGR